MKRIEWTEEQRDAFADKWPCCDIPATGFVEIDDNGYMVGVSENTRDCENCGGLGPFICDLEKEYNAQEGRS